MNTTDLNKTPSDEIAMLKQQLAQKDVLYKALETRCDGLENRVKELETKVAEVDTLKQQMAELMALVRK
jgi:phage shock protein A